MKRGVKVLLLAAALCLAGVASATAAPAGPDAPSAVYIWGYAGSQSVVQGGTIDLHVSTTFKSFDFVVYRYGAAGLQPMQRVNGIAGQWRDCPNSHLGCGWPVSYQLAVPESWRSGLYALQLISAGNTPAMDYASWILFVVRPKNPGSTSPVLYMLNEFTWQAYNYCSGLSFYPDTQSGRGRANYLSFDRPYCTGDQPLTPACSYEWGCAPFRNLPLIKWLESNNYVVEYAANYDIHSDPTLLSHYRFFMDDAHDEYWSWPMRDQAEGFIARGGNAAFFSSNTSFWQVRLEDAGRTLVGFKNEVGKDPVLLDADPANDRLATTNWCVAPVNRCETQMLGISYFNGGNGKAKSCSYCSGGFQAWNPTHWIWAGTGIKSGQSFGTTDAYGLSVGIAATEVDGALWQMAVGRAKDHAGGHQPGHAGQLPDPGTRHRLALRRQCQQRGRHHGRLHQHRRGHRLGNRQLGLGRGRTGSQEPHRRAGHPKRAGSARVQRAQCRPSLRHRYGRRPPGGRGHGGDRALRRVLANGVRTGLRGQFGLRHRHRGRRTRHAGQGRLRRRGDSRFHDRRAAGGPANGLGQ